MSATPEVLEQFIRDSRGRAERLSELLLDAAGPSGAAVANLATEVRDAASAADLHTLASLADAVRRAGSALADGALHWEPSLGGALMTAVDELGSLVNSAMAWDQTSDARAKACTDELGVYAPGAPAAAPPAPAASDRRASAPPDADPRPVVPIESLFYSAAAASVETAASLLDSSIAAMGALSDALTGRGPNTLADRSRGAAEEGELVPVEELEYRGAAALDRAMELRDELREAGGVPDKAALDELYDLIALARAG